MGMYKTQYGTSVAPNLLMFSLLSTTEGVYESEKAFIQDLKMMWFGLYSRYNGKMDSSGFEHIFAGQLQ